MEFEKACSEIDYILSNMSPDDIDKIPQQVRDFFKKNKSNTYKVNIDVSKQLKDQELKDETKAFIKILYIKYFATKEERKKLIKDLISL